MVRRRHADRVLEAATSGAAAASRIAASWRRSLLNHRLDPADERGPERLDEAALREARELSGPLLAAAAPFLDRLHATVGQAGCSVLLTDADGVVLDQRSPASDATVFRRWGLWSGGRWSEAAEGTNGIGTCLAEARPVTIHRDEHFLSRNTAMTCIDAPLFGADGGLVGALDVSTCRADHTQAVAALISAVLADAARGIESDLFRARYPTERIVVCDAAGSGSNMLIAIDADDLVVGATRAARKAFGFDPARDGPRPAADLLGREAAPESLDAAERTVLRLALTRAGGDRSAAARALGIGRATLYRRMKRHGLG
ncbi:MAG: GAF domain-containing protein [Rubrimonas sp.]